MTNFLLNNEQLNQEHYSASLIQDDVVFDGYSLMTYFNGTEQLGIALQTGNLFDLNNIDVGSYVSEQIDGGWVFFKKYGNKQITLNLYIQGSSYADLLERIENLKRYTATEEADFDVRVNGQIRSYTATVTDITFPRFDMNTDFLEWIQMQLLITSPHWSLKDGVTEIESPVAADFQKVIYNQGKYDAYPKVYLICKPTGNALTGVSITLRKTSETIGDAVSVSTTITNNDVLVFDYKEKIVTLNWDEIDFDGFMTPIKDGYNVFAVDFTGTANINFFIKYNPTFR